MHAPIITEAYFLIMVPLARYLCCATEHDISSQTVERRNPGCDQHQKDAFCSGHCYRCLCVFNIMSVRASYTYMQECRNGKKNEAGGWVGRDGMDAVSHVANRVRISVEENKIKVGAKRNGGGIIKNNAMT